MTFRSLIESVSSAVRVADAFTIVVAIASTIGINVVFDGIPLLAATILFVLFYIAGFIVACYRKDAEIERLGKVIAGYDDEFDLDRFDWRSCHVMVDVHDAELGPNGSLYLDDDNFVAAGLVNAGVLERSESPAPVRFGKHAYRLTPSWRKFVTEHLDAIEERSHGPI